MLELRSYGISGQRLNRIESIFCRIDRSRPLSNVTNLTSGVAQGNVIGPLLFGLFINDIVSVFDDNNCVYKLYADDVKLYTVLQTETHYFSLQSKLKELYE